MERIREKEKNNQKYGFILLALMLVLAAYITIDTFAKYTATVSGTDSARVAKFDFSAVIDNMNLSSTASEMITIFDTVNLGDNIKDGVNTTLIAPGAKGDFAVKLTNATGEVPVTTTANVTYSNAKNVNLKFFIGDTEPTSDDQYTATTESVEKTLEDALTADLAVGGSGSTVKVFWKWVDSDVEDTVIGLEGTAEVSLLIEVTGTQKQS